MKRAAGARGIALVAAITLVVGSAAGVAFARLSSGVAGLVIPSPRPGLDIVASAPLQPSTQPVGVDAIKVTAAPARPARKAAQPNAASCGRAGASVVRFRVAVDRGLRVAPATFLAGVRGVLCDRRSWIASGRVRFVYDPHGRYLLALRSPEATEQRCRQLTGLSVNEHYSCASAGSREAVLNADRWLYGSSTWSGSVARYRALLVNHEVGHVLGQGHRPCQGAGPAPVMMQQSKGIGGCTANPWPLAYELRSLRW